MPNLFENDRCYLLGDPDLDIIGDREKLAQWRHKMRGPAFYRLGREITYHGSDLNDWGEASRVDPALRGPLQWSPQLLNRRARIRAVIPSLAIRLLCPFRMSSAMF